MTLKDYTALVFVVDRSGSMGSIASDMEGGISSLLDEQAALPGKLTVDVVLFDDMYDEIATFAPADFRFQIHPRGMTALNDAIGRKVTSFGEALKALPEDDRPENVLFVIVTDGHENCSTEYSAAQVKKLVQHQTSKYNWNFVYLGANQDAVHVGGKYGIAPGASLTYNTSNVSAMTTSLSGYASATRSGVSNNTFSDEDRKNNA